jgi:hypothetical protein
VKWAVFKRANVISMSWTIKSDPKYIDDEILLANQIIEAEKGGIVLFCSSEDKGQHNNNPGQLLPSRSNLLRRIGSCNGNGNKSEFVSEAEVHYLFPGEQLPVMQQHLKRTGNKTSSTDRGSSASTALASGLASLVLWCTIKSGDKKRRFANARMYALFDKLRTDQDQSKPSLVDVSGLMDDVKAQGQTAQKTVEMFVNRLMEKIPDDMRRYDKEILIQKGPDPFD